MTRRVSDAAVELLPYGAHRSEAWHELRRTTVSASEVAALLGLSPYVSAFDLWWLKRSGDDSQSDSKALRRGRRMEPFIIDDFRDEHEELHVETVGFSQSVARPYQTCSPDALVYDVTSYDVAAAELHDPVVTCTVPIGEPLAVLEAKTDNNRSAWGDDGSDIIPVQYRCQLLWQMDVFDLDVGYVAAWVVGDYHEFVIVRDAAAQHDIELMRAAAVDFLDSIKQDRPPPIDAHEATTRRLKMLHSGVEQREVELDAKLITRRRIADKRVKYWEQRRDLYDNQVRALLEDAKIGTVDGRKAVSRSVSQIKERTQIVKAHTQSRLYYSKEKDA